jgi:hypothetical protein
MDTIGKIYESIFISRAIVICQDDDQVEKTRIELKTLDYPVMGNSIDAIKMIVLTFVDLLQHPNPMLDQTSLIFTFDLENIGDICKIAQENGIGLVVKL